MAKRKLKKGVIVKGIILIITIILLIVFVNVFRYLRSDSRKLKHLGYNNDEILLMKNTNKDFLNAVFEREYNDHIPNLISQKYFIEEHLERYIEFANKSLNLHEYDEIIALVNTNNDYAHYDKIIETDYSQNEKMLVNRFYKLNSSFSGNDLKEIPLQYSYANNRLNNDALTAYISLWRAARGNGFNLIANGSFRSYESQNSIYERNRAIDGTSRTDQIISRPGHSEHQTGYALDIHIVGKTLSNFDSNDEFEWLIENAHTHGFILRYPKNKEHITGFNYEPWHFRYVGEEIATYIYKNNITFDEYFAFYLDKIDGAIEELKNWMFKN